MLPTELANHPINWLDWVNAVEPQVLVALRDISGDSDLEKIVYRASLDRVTADEGTIAFWRAQEAVYSGRPTEIPPRRRPWGLLPRPDRNVSQLPWHPATHRRSWAGNPGPA